MNPRLEKLDILKHIFLSSNDQELLEHFKRLNPIFDLDTVALEADFNRYFIGPDKPLAVPYASVYIDQTQSVMTEATQKVRQIYDLVGLINPLKNQQPDDFIGLELDAYFQLLYLEMEKDIEFLQEVRLYFLQEHLALWIFAFCDQILTNTTFSSQPIQLLAKELKNFFEQEIQLEGALL